LNQGCNGIDSATQFLSDRPAALSGNYCFSYPFKNHREKREHGARNKFCRWPVARPAGFKKSISQPVGMPRIYLNSDPPELRPGGDHARNPVRLSHILAQIVKELRCTLSESFRKRHPA
jgi:hypothetical protein